jgi:hypothetical protein
MNDTVLFPHFCKYRDILGRVGEGSHSYRIFDLAIVDIVSTILAAVCIQYFLLPKYSLAIVIFGFFCLGIFFHRLFCVPTTIDKFLFGIK